MTRSLTALAATAILAASIGFAGAQGTGKSEMISTDTQCWDTTLNMPRERMPVTSGTTTGANTTATNGAKAATGAASKGPNEQSSISKRPTGMKNC
jgi:hypothetical protein